MSRSSLFDAFRRAAAPEPEEERPPPPRPSFSLDDFYARRGDRSEQPAGTLPLFQVRAKERVPTTPIGRGPSAPAPGTSTASALPAFAGKVRVRTHTCLAWQRSFCSVCSEHCPVPGAIVVEEGRPRVDPAQCNGCGRCVAACPAPINGFDILAKEDAT